ncbi:hypothetical protein DK846_14455 [Methanospirillum lacunae]|uniref:Uncharacterized protein n=1 Tax=Methanospirillum lacunae TaxID=668570 RepID=A0A2V2MWH9_9EURY|nr:hypothetical protein DK846_14455 [Methanospirillum lacunae]
MSHLFGKIEGVSPGSDCVFIIIRRTTKWGCKSENFSVSMVATGCNTKKVRVVGETFKIFGLMCY